MSNKRTSRMSFVSVERHTKSTIRVTNGDRAATTGAPLLLATLGSRRRSTATTTAQQPVVNSSSVRVTKTTLTVNSLSPQTPSTDWKTPTSPLIAYFVCLSTETKLILEK
ncbi:unnamed protein product [Oppiella nova]|uniref:Uncharacterized protein n=1 Tax=Oppiella nova TaxID=334625 RepID=A0A7R9M2A2_9ACAR|nr:unnamed protein product [Oppiella nova]CAG2169208.1 unnamed protein product [Oppiella nova]